MKRKSKREREREGWKANEDKIRNYVGYAIKYNNELSWIVSFFFCFWFLLRMDNSVWQMKTKNVYVYQSRLNKQSKEKNARYVRKKNAQHILNGKRKKTAACIIIITPITSVRGFFSSFFFFLLILSSSFFFFFFSQRTLTLL